VVALPLRVAGVVLTHDVGLLLVSRTKRANRGDAQSRVEH
jgi:hypothetical protein